MTADSVYDKLRMFNGQAASWAWYGATPTATHLGLPAGPPTHPALTHPFQPREIQEDKKPGKFAIFTHMNIELTYKVTKNRWADIVTFITVKNLILNLLNI